MATRSRELPLGRLVSTLFEPAGTALPAVLFVHGYESSRAGYADRAAATSEALTAICLTFDLSGHGDSGGEMPTIRDHVAEVVGAYDELARHPQVDPNRIGICGASYGGFVAAWATTMRPVPRLLLRAPGLYADAALDGREVTTVLGVDTSRLFAGLNESRADVLVLESENDEIIPREVIEAYLTGCPRAQHAVLRDATHGLMKPEWDRAFVDVIIDWFASL